MPQYIRKVALPEIHISIPIDICNSGSLAFGIIKRERCKETKVVAAPADLIFK
jgi:hypothetical protein